MNLSDKKVQMFLGIMIFYALLSYVIFPAIFYNFVEKSLTSAGNGFIVGSILSIGLWYFVGCGMVNKT